MKKVKINIMQWMLLALLLTLTTIQTIKAQPTVNVSFDIFRNELSPYGDWIYEPAYGDVWVPDAGPDFRPYHSNGRWVMTDYGNTWVSDYDWGWAPFHYGRWTRNSRRGWMWVPDTEWAPAWVTWRGNDDYYGWAPVAPILNISLSPQSYAPPVDWWTFVPATYIYEPQWVNYYPGYSRNPAIIQNTTIINNVYKGKSKIYISGPAADDIRRKSRKDVQVYKIGNDNRPGKMMVGNNTVNMYRPAIDRKTRSSGTRDGKRPETYDKSNNLNKSKGNRQTSPVQKERGGTQDRKDIKQKGQDRRPGNYNKGREKPQNRPQQKQIRQQDGRQHKTELRKQPGSQRKEIRTQQSRPQQREMRQQRPQAAQSRQMKQQPQHRPQNREIRQQPQNHPRQQVRQAPAQSQPRGGGGGGKQGGGKGRGK